MGNTQSKVIKFKNEIPPKGWLENYVTKDRSRKKKVLCSMQVNELRDVLKEYDLRTSYMKLDLENYWSFIPYK